MKTYDEIMRDMLSRVPDTVDKREGSLIHDALAPSAIELAQAYAALEENKKEGYADTASRSFLIRRAAERGMKPYEATAAIVKGRTQNSAELEVGQRFSLDEINFVITEKLGNHEYKLGCETKGAIGNKSSGSLTPVDYIAGLQKFDIVELMIPGEDAEPTEAFRKRYFASFESQAFGGNIADYKEKVDALQGVGGVKVYPAKMGAGTVGLTIISAEYTAPSSELIQQVQNAVDPVAGAGTGKGFAPIGHRVTVSGVTETVINITATITYASSWNFLTARSHIEKAVDGYFKELAKVWADSETLVVRIAQIESRLLFLDAVLDISGTRLNGTASNVQLDKDAIPKRGTLNG